MKKHFMFYIFSLLLTGMLFAQSQDTTQTRPKQQPTPKKKAKKSNVYYGGTLGLSFGNYFRINVAPMVGMRLNPKTSVGFKVAYEYIKDKRYDPALTASNYGGSVFTRYRLVPKLYAHAEFAYMSYKYKLSDLETDRTWVPFLLLGGGFVQPLSPKASLIVEVLFDVLQDSNSPYENWDPFISIGVGVGF
ncbi:MAG: hypothetical protein JSW33_03220 [bacterium]|nr:MAG: hypothetical protein JSW33_03220 [bacterium]